MCKSIVHNGVVRYNVVYATILIIQTHELTIAFLLTSSVSKSQRTRFSNLTEYKPLSNYIVIKWPSSITSINVILSMLVFQKLCVIPVPIELKKTHLLYHHGFPDWDRRLCNVSGWVEVRLHRPHRRYAVQNMGCKRIHQWSLPGNWIFGLGC